MPLDYDAARETLATEYELAEEFFRNGGNVDVPHEIQNATERLFASRTQAYREALIGCALARIQDQNINIRLPYVNQGEAAFNGRTLDQTVVNPFLQDHQIPSTKNPYLSVIRRGFRFVPEQPGQRDTRGYSALLSFIDHLETADSETARRYLRFLLVAFVRLRDAADIPLSDVRRLSLEQYDELIDQLLAVRTGGLMPVLLSVAMFRTLSDCFELEWQIDWQGINVADAARGVGGDITVTRRGNLLFSVEVTEREIDRNRVVGTFNGKIAPNGIDDYLFFFTATEPTQEARDAARQYFAQGHDVNFVPIKTWIMTTLTTIGPRCRRIFTEQFREILTGDNVPATLKVGWNDALQAIIVI